MDIGTNILITARVGMRCFLSAVCTYGKCSEWKQNGILNQHLRWLGSIVVRTSDL